MFDHHMPDEVNAAIPGAMPENFFSLLYRSPALLVLVVASSVFAAEALTMFFLAHLPGLPTTTAVFLDSACLLFLLIPSFTFFIFRPLLQQITERKLAVDALQLERQRLFSLLEEVRHSREQLRNLSAHLQTAREEERTAVAREIHDELGQILATIQLDVSWLAGGLRDDQQPLVEKAEAISLLVRNTVKTVQRISTELRPGMLDDLGLADAVEWQAAEFEKRSGISCRIAIGLESETIDRDVSTAIYRIFQESLTNVLRHSGATGIKGHLSERNGRILLMLRDNGRGITPEQINDPHSIGLIGMRERTLMLGGRIRVCGAPGKGTAVFVRIPARRNGAVK